MRLLLIAFSGQLVLMRICIASPNNASGKTSNNSASLFVAISVRFIYSSPHPKKYCLAPLTEIVQIVTSLVMLRH
jgi:hypothetical protein